MIKFKILFTAAIFTVASLFSFSTEPLKIPEDDVISPKFRVMADAAEDAEVDILVVYTPASKQWAESRGGIEKWVNDGFIVSNKVVTDSNIGLTFNLLASIEVPYAEHNSSLVNLRRMTFGYDNAVDGYNTGVNYFQDVRDLRDSIGADLVIFINAIGNAAGLAWQLSNPSGRDRYGYSVVMVHYFNSFTKVHEIGHNMGAHHNYLQNSSPGPGLFPYSAGYKWTGLEDNKRYVSVMSYTSGYPEGFTGTRVGLFSSPLLIHKGSVIGDAILADNARSMMETKHTIAAYRHRPIDPFDSLGVNIKIDSISYDYISAIVTASGTELASFGLVWSVDTVDLVKVAGDTIQLRYLWPNTEYFLRGFAASESDTIYTNWFVVSTLEQPIPPLQIPTNAKVSITELSYSSVRFRVTAEGDSVLHRGIKWGPTTDPVWVVNALPRSGVIIINGLKESSKYYYKGYAINRAGEYVGPLEYFITEDKPIIIDPPQITNNVIIYPNPTTGGVYITFNGPFRFRVSAITGRSANLGTLTKWSKTLVGATYFVIPVKGTFIITVHSYGRVGKMKNFTILVQ